MSKKEQDHIDELFREGLGGMESRPSDHLWDKIAEGVPGAELDEFFHQALADEEQQPSYRVWEGVQQELPLNLPLKRSLNRMVVVAGMVVGGMLLLLAVKMWDAEASPTPTPQPPSENPVEYAWEEIIIEPTPEQIEEADSDKPKPAKAKSGRTMDKSLEKDVKPAELNLHADDGLEVDEAKMQRILAPISNPDLDAAVARVNRIDNKVTESQDGTLIPDDLDKVMPRK